VSPLNSSQDVDKIMLIIDGQRTVFSPGTLGKAFVWPGPGPQSLQLKVQLQGGSELTIATYEGLWSVYRFIKEAEGHSGTQVEKRPMSGTQPVTGPSGQPVIVRLDFNPNLQNIFASKSCAPEVSRQ
jgi:hypothetical protein